MEIKIVEAILKSLYKRGLITDAERENILDKYCKMSQFPLD